MFPNWDDKTEAEKKRCLYDVTFILWEEIDNYITDTNMLLSLSILKCRAKISNCRLNCLWSNFNVCIGFMHKL